jgi:glycosyltransferase involved in cell wall biosynthesis
MATPAADRSTERIPWTGPRIGVISDVSPEDSVSGQKLLYRLLSSWDASALRVFDGNVWPSEPSKRLPGVEYRVVNYAPVKFFHTRITGLANALCLRTIRQWTTPLARAMEEFRAEAILTVAHGHLLLAASQVARRLDLPLHVLLHDDWPTTMPGGGWPGSALHARFKDVYAHAASRLCVSPYMEEEYRRRYGIPGSVLLPSRDSDTPLAQVSRRVRRRDGFVLAYCGSIPNQDYVLRLRGAAEAMGSLKGRLDIYTNVSNETLARMGLAGANVRACGFLPARELHRVVAETADGLLLPMSFAIDDRATMSVCFPSKLVEYTAIGLPVIVWGPTYSAGVRWVSEHGGSALAVTESDQAAFRAAVQRLSSDKDLATDAAERLVAAGNAQFDSQVISARFRAGVSGGRLE